MSTWRPLPGDPADDEARPLAASLELVARRLGAPGAAPMAAVFSRWAEVVGEEVAAHATPVSLRDGVLKISVDHAAWATQLRYLQADLLARLHAAAGGDAVQEIVLSVRSASGSRRSAERPPRL